jgi:hypothetical protein
MDSIFLYIIGHPILLTILLLIGLPFSIKRMINSYKKANADPEPDMEELTKLLDENNSEKKVRALMARVDMEPINYRFRFRTDFIHFLPYWILTLLLTIMMISQIISGEIFKKP